MSKVNLGGDRLGSGAKIDVALRNYERSTHDLGYIWRSTMSAGTLVPCFNELTLPGDTFEIDIDCDVMTHPTIGPLFGSYKVQIDIFAIPFRLYQPDLSMNLNGVGLKMDQVLLPQLGIEAQQHLTSSDYIQVNPSCVLAYLGIAGIGSRNAGQMMYREFNAIPYLGYVDIYKNYYANKQEGTNLWDSTGVVIHNDLLLNNYTDAAAQWHFAGNGNLALEEALTKEYEDGFNVSRGIDPYSRIIFTFTTLTEIDVDRIWVTFNNNWRKITDLYADVVVNFDLKTVVASKWKHKNKVYKIGQFYIDQGITNSFEESPKLRRFPLEHIDLMRKQLLKWDTEDGPFLLNAQMQDIEPYSLLFHSIGIEGNNSFSIQSNQEGLLIKTYQSDVLNNWVNTEWLEGENGINSISAVQVIDNEFTIDQLNLKKKIYEALMRVAVSDGTYNSWVKATWDHDGFKGFNTPMYLGGYSTELMFQEIVSNAGTEEQPLGTLAGRGKLAQNHKGGKVIVRTDEPSYIMGIVSLTPRVDYSQGNKWDVNLKTMDELHKPQLDGIGFQDLITDHMAYFDTQVDNVGTVTFSSAGKQPAWINYQTNLNRVYGNFALENQQMWMTLNRRYEREYNAQGGVAGIKDITTYIDPMKFNHIFADTRLDAQNFWVQIKWDVTARRKMSARQIPGF